MTERAAKPPHSERVEIPGPAGFLEAVVDTPVDSPPGGFPAPFGIVCHPHPLQGGTLTNKVVHTVARAFNEMGVPTVRFNFRGVGASTGRYDEGRGETDDALAAIAYGTQRWPGAALWLAGFSFGGAIAIRASETSAPALLVAVAPAVTRLSVPGRIVPRCPWLIVQGDADDVIEPQKVLEWAGRLEPPPVVKILAGAGHFFHGRLIELRHAVIEFVSGSQREEQV